MALVARTRTAVEARAAECREDGAPKAVAITADATIPEALANAVNGCHTDLNIDGSGKGVCYVVACNSSNNSGFNYVPQIGTCGGSNPPRDGPTGIGCNYACPVWPTTATVSPG